jgi:mRNA-degrading endonuclease RelE of RelBE toxin-antitoxin system
LTRPSRSRYSAQSTASPTTRAQGRQSQLVGDPRTWRVRSSDWRVLYEIRDDELIVLVLDVGHRSKACPGH